MKYLFEFYGISFNRKKRSLKGVALLTDEEVSERQKQFHTLKDSYQYRKELTEKHLDYLNSIVKEEEARLSTIESKIGQIIGQSGILLALISLFAPLFYDKLNHLHIVLKLIILLLFFIGFLFFMVSIFQATKTLNIRDFIYVRPSVNTVLNKEYKDEQAFFVVQIKDLISGITNNIKTNNLKGNLLLYSHRAFRTGLIVISLLGLLIISLFTFNKKPDNPIIIDSLVYLKNLNQRAESLEEALNVLEDKVHDGALKSLFLDDSVRMRSIQNSLDSVRREVKKLNAEIKAKGDSSLLVN